MPLCFMLNDQPLEVGDADPNTTLLAFLRSRGLTGTKEGCAEGECGACAVVVTRPSANGARYEAANACLMLLGKVAGCEVRTVEGVAQGGALHPVQEALVQHGGSQCGYCTPGFVMSLFAEYYRAGRQGIDPDAVAGNLCRCTGYRPILDAARSLGSPAAGDPHSARLSQPVARPACLELASGSRTLARPRSLSELWPLLARTPAAKLFAGGTDAVVEMNLKQRRHEHIILLDEIDELRACREDTQELCFGAATPLSEIERRFKGRVMALDQLWPLFASQLVRAQATLGGNLGTASPIGDASPLLLALDAELLLASAASTRSLPIADFFTGYRATALGPGEIIKTIRLPKPLAPFTRFAKVAKRPHDDISSVSLALALTFDDDARVRRARVALGGVADRPMRALAAETALTGEPLSLAQITRATQELKAHIRPISDVRASAHYRSRVAAALLERLLREALPKGAPDV